MRALAWRAVWLLATSFAVGACAGKQDAAGAGQDCYRDQDCKSGLVCVANTAGNRVCSSDVNSLKSTVEGPPPAEDAGVPVSDAAVPVDDAGMQAAGGAQ